MAPAPFSRSSVADLIAKMCAADGSSKVPFVSELGRRHSADATRALLGELRPDSDPRVLAAAVDALADGDTYEAAPRILVLFENEQLPPEVHDTCAHALGRLEYHEAAPALARALTSSCPTVRTCSATSLAPLQATEYTDRLAALGAKEENERARCAMMEAHHYLSRARPERSE